MKKNTKNKIDEISYAIKAIGKDIAPNLSKQTKKHTKKTNEEKIMHLTYSMSFFFTINHCLPNT